MSTFLHFLNIPHQILSNPNNTKFYCIQKYTLVDHHNASPDIVQINKNMFNICTDIRTVASFLTSVVMTVH